MLKEPPPGTFLLVFHYNMYYLIWHEVDGWSVSGTITKYTWNQLIYWFDERYLGIARKLVLVPDEVS